MSRRSYINANSLEDQPIAKSRSFCARGLFGRPSGGHIRAINGLSYASRGERAMDVGGWLRGLGLGQCEDRFRDNRIDAEVLPQLTADDLREIGVAAVGDRRKLLAAIAAL